MKKIQKRPLRVILVLLMLGTSPISVTYSFAEIDNNQDKKEQNYSQINEYLEKEDQKIILTEEVVNGKLQVRQYSLPEDTTDDDLQRGLSFDGKTSSWAYVNAKAYHSGIVLFDGKASKVGDNLWTISIIDSELREKQFDLESSEKYDRSHSTIQESGTYEEFDYRVVFSGKIAETEDQSIFAINLMNAGLKNMEMGQNVKNLQFSELTINVEKSIEPIKYSEIQYR